MINRALVFSPYFGKLPDNFPLWLKSAERNADLFDFCVITDDDHEFDLPDNVSVITTSFEELREWIQSKFPFKIALTCSYKLCDFKPTYGYVFSELLDMTLYDYWGICDLDVIFGDLSAFIPHQPYDRINHCGHFSLFRNAPEVNRAFMLNSTAIRYDKILSNPTHFAFDENGEYGINAILRKNGFHIGGFEDDIARITYRRHNLDVGAEYDRENNKTVSYDKRKRLFAFEEGRLFDYAIDHGEIVQREWAYIHLMRRRMANLLPTPEERFLISAHAYEPYQAVTLSLIEEKQMDSYYFDYIKIKARAGVRKARRIATVRILQMQGQNSDL